MYRRAYHVRYIQEECGSIGLKGNKNNEKASHSGGLFTFASMKISAVFLLFNLGGGEILLILVAAIMMFGSKRIPEIARGLGKGIREVRNATNDIKREIQKGINEAESQVEQATRVAEEPAKEVNEVPGAINRKKSQPDQASEQSISEDPVPNNNKNQEPQ